MVLFRGAIGDDGKFWEAGSKGPGYVELTITV